METLNEKQQEILSLAKYGKWVKYQVKLAKIDYTEEDLICILKHIRYIKNNTEPTYIQRFVDDIHANVFNKFGFPIIINKKVQKEFNHLQPFKANFKDIWNGYHIAEKELKFRLACKLKLPIFQNGNLYVKTNKHIKDLVNN